MRIKRKVTLYSWGKEKKSKGTDDIGNKTHVQKRRKKRKFKYLILWKDQWNWWTFQRVIKDKKKKMQAVTYNAMNKRGDMSSDTGEWLNTYNKSVIREYSIQHHDSKFWKAR